VQEVAFVDPHVAVNSCPEIVEAADWESVATGGATAQFTERTVLLLHPVAEFHA
jgi:hypothetical protein